MHNRRTRENHPPELGATGNKEISVGLLLNKQGHSNLQTPKRTVCDCSLRTGVFYSKDAWRINEATKAPQQMLCAVTDTCSKLSCIRR